MSEYNKEGRGTKLDYGKAQFHYLPFDLMDGENRVWAKGAIKYSPMQWRNGMPYTQPLNAAIRHLTTFLSGVDNDAETDESHLDHAICCIRMAQSTQKYLVKTNPELDDRIKWFPV